MTKELIVTAKTIDEAIEKGLLELGLDRDSISVEVLATPSKGFLFGIGATDAEVKISYEVEAKDPPPTRPPVKKPAEPAVKTAEVPPRGEPAQKPPRPKQEPQKPAEKKRERPVAAEPAPPRAQPEPEPVPEQKPFVPVEGTDAERFLREVFGILEMEVSMRAETDGELLRVSVQGEHMALLIGRRGETLDALQYLTGLATGRGDNGYRKVSIDIENYRAKREEALVALAHKTAARVVKERRAVTLEAMNPYERRVIHATLQGVPGVQTSSVGHEPNRRVMVSPAEGGARPSGGTSSSRRRKPRGRGGNRPTRPQGAAESEQP
ncbi:MAG: KH domain-containing protein [Clostridiales bacterium]|nr:KH domain-containing protein [Clostridiales bacterium]